MNIPTRQPKNTVAQATSTVQTAPQKTSEEKLLDFVSTEIEKFQQYSNLGNPDEMPGFFQMNQALTNWGSVNCSLLSLDVMAKAELQKADDAFHDWLAEKYMTARETLNPMTRASTKWASSKEIEYYVRTTWADEYDELSSEFHACEMKVAFIRRLIENWQSQLKVLTRLSRNIEAEATKLGAAFLQD